MKTAVIYGIRNTNSGKYYVGSTRDLATRWENHRRLLESNRHSPKLQEAWNDSSPAEWEWVVLESDIPLVHQFASEQHWIDALESFSDGYNSSPRAGSYVSIGFKAYDHTIEERADNILAMLLQIEGKVPYRQIAKQYRVSVGFLSNLKVRYSDLIEGLIKQEAANRERVSGEKGALAERKARKADRDKQIINLLKAGQTYREVGQAVRCALGTIHNVAKRSQLTHSKR